MPKVELVYFSDCPNVERARAALRVAKARDIAEVAQDHLEPGHPYLRFSSPTILIDGRVIVGSRNDAAACSAIDWESVAARIVKSLGTPRRRRASR